MNTGIVILAAGSSSRMGKPKQLLQYRGKTLLDTVSAEALKTPFRPVVTVLGAHAEEISDQYSPPGITCIINTRWQDGMSSSISAGVAAVLDQNKDTENIIIAVADQAFITSAIFEGLLLKHRLTAKNIIASSYAGTAGTPALFSRIYFDQLLALNGEHGAKQIMKQHPGDTETLPFERGDIDIDTEDDYNNLTGAQ